MPDVLDVPSLKEYPIAEAYPIALAAIQEMEREYMPLVVEADGTGLKEVHAARMVVKKHRVAVEKKRKELKADVLEAGRRIDGVAKQLFGPLEKIESHLDNEEKTYTEEQERIKQAEFEAKQAILVGKVEALAAYEYHTTTWDVEKWTAAEYDEVLGKARIAHEEKLKAEAEAKAEAERLEAERVAREAAEAEQRRKELEQLAAERAEREAEAAKLAAEREAIEAEKRKLAEEAAERDRQAEMERREKAAAQAERERIEREAHKAKLIAEAEAEEAKRIEELRPDQDKVRAFADAVESMVLPLLSDKASGVQEKISMALKVCAAEIRTIASARM